MRLTSRLAATRCVCGQQVLVNRLSPVVGAAVCTRCGRWFTFTRRTLVQRFAGTLMRAISRCAHPDDIFQVLTTLP